jgi:hypothetical protein
MAGCASRRGGAANVYADHVELLALKYMRGDIEEEAFCWYHVGGVCEIGERARASWTESGPSESSCFVPTTKYFTRTVLQCLLNEKKIE